MEVGGGKGAIWLEGLAIGIKGLDNDRVIYNYRKVAKLLIIAIYRW